MTSPDRRPLLAVSMFWLLHTIGLVLIVAEPTSLFDARPFLDQDWGLHHTHLVAAEAFWEMNGQLWGYNPFYMAGFPSNTHLDASIKAFELAALFTPGVNTLLAFKLWVFAATSAIPWLCVLAVLGLSNEPRPGWTAALAAGLAVASWWSGFGREMLFYGMIGWPVGCALALVVLSLLARIIRSEKSFSAAHVGWLFGCILLLPVHLQASIMLPLPGLVLLLMSPRRQDPRVWAWAVGGVGLALGVNAFWLGPLFAHFGDENAGRVVASLPVFVSLDVLTFVKDYFTSNNYWSFRETALGNLFRLGLLCMGVAGLARLHRAGRTQLSACLATLVGTIFVLTYFGSLHERVQLLQPLRFKVALDLTLAVCAAFAFEGWPSASARWRSGLTIALCVAILGAFATVASTESTGRMRIHATPIPPVAALVDWLRDEAPRDARILFEESGDETGFVHGGIYLSSFLPSWTGRQLIGGPTNLYADRHAFAELHSGRLFGRDPRSFSDDELKRYLDLYNIGMVVAFHPLTVQRFAHLGDPVVPVRRFGRYVAVFRIDRNASWFLEGQGSVEARLGELSLHDVRPDSESGSIVLKYHWIEGMRAEPPLRLDKTFREDDPIPFIRIEDPPASFRLGTGD